MGTGRVRVRLLAGMSLLALALGAAVHAPPASAAPPSTRSGVLSQRVPEDPPLVTEPWDGKTGVEFPADPLVRGLVADIAELDDDPAIREAAAKVLAADAANLEHFLSVEHPALQREAFQQAGRQARADEEAVRKLAGTGGPYFNEEVTRVLAGSAADRAAFLAYGADIARQHDEDAQKATRDLTATLRQRVNMIATAAPDGSEVRRSAEAALAGGDAAIAKYWESGYRAAAAVDAQAQEKHLADLEARNKAAEELSELAQRSKTASLARTELLTAHGVGVRSLKEAANAMGAAANNARHAERVLASDRTAASKSSELAAAKAEAVRHLGYAKEAADRARAAAITATEAAGRLVGTGLTYGAQWAAMAVGMREAADAAVGAATTAQHAIDATTATHNAQTDQAKAEAHAKQAEQWRRHAQNHAAAAKSLADAAKRQAGAAKDAAERTRIAREQAEHAKARAVAAAHRTKQHRLKADEHAKKAAEARADAKRERERAAAARAKAERNAAIARNARANAQRQRGIAAEARRRSESADRSAGEASRKAGEHEGNAMRLRDEAHQKERDEQTAKSKEAAFAELSRKAENEPSLSDEQKGEARRHADEARQQSNVASRAARSARSSANTATGAAANARAASMEANRAAERAWAAFQRARAAAAAADREAEAAEADAKLAHAARLDADAKAAEATAQEARAAEAADEAVRLAEQAATEAVQSLWAAQRTQAEADAAVRESVSAAAQATVALTAAAAARDSAAGIADPHNAALAMVAPFQGNDVDADFTIHVAELAKVIGEEQAAAATRRAAEAVTAADKADAAAQEAQQQVKEAFQAAAQAARSAADAAASAAHATASAVDAARDGAAARTAAAGAAEADKAARADAQAARKSANDARRSADLAGRDAAAAQRDADAARDAANRADRDAAAARAAARSAEADAAAANRAATSAEQHADDAAKSATNAHQYAAEVQQAAIRNQEAARKEGETALANPTPTTPDQQKDAREHLSKEDQEALRKAQEEKNKDFWAWAADEGLKELIGIVVDEDLQACLKQPNFESCAWGLVKSIGPAKLFKAGWKGVKALWDLPGKIKKFRKLKDDAQKLEKQLLEKANKKKRDRDEPDGCKGSAEKITTARLLRAEGVAKPASTVVVNSGIRKFALAAREETSCESFENQMADVLETELRRIDELGVRPTKPGSREFDRVINEDATEMGKVKWAVLQDGTLVVVPKFVGRHEIPHTALTRGKPVLAAGEAVILGNSRDGYFGLEIDNHSGHYKPSQASKSKGVAAFKALGVTFR